MKAAKASGKAKGGSSSPKGKQGPPPLKTNGNDDEHHENEIPDERPPDSARPNQNPKLTPGGNSPNPSRPKVSGKQANAAKPRSNVGPPPPPKAGREGAHRGADSMERSM